MASSPHATEVGCNKVDLPSNSCYIRFSPQTGHSVDINVVKAVILQLETVRGETLALDLNKAGAIVGIELFAPGLKPCQPHWAHNFETTSEVK